MPVHVLYGMIYKTISKRIYATLITFLSFLLCTTVLEDKIKVRIIARAYRNAWCLTVFVLKKFSFTLPVFPPHVRVLLQTHKNPLDYMPGTANRRTVLDVIAGDLEKRSFV